LPADSTQLVHLKFILDEFAISTGLKINYHKSNIYPINVPEIKIQQLISSLNCQLGTFPFTCLGLPLDLSKPRTEHMLPLATKVERRLLICSDFLATAGKLELVNSVLSSLPGFFMSTLSIYQGVIDQVDKYRRHCLRRKGDISQNIPTIAAWSTICKPKDKGGLGVIDLKLQNECLLLKFLDKFFNKKDIPWVHLVWESYYDSDLPPAKSRDCSFWWHDCLKILQKFKDLSSCSLNNGSTILLWKDTWSEQPLANTLPHLASFAKTLDISVQKASSTEPLLNLFHLPLSEVAFSELNTLNSLLQNSVSDD
jgi:hypothetical protein